MTRPQFDAYNAIRKEVIAEGACSWTDFRESAHGMEVIANGQRRWTVADNGTVKAA
jgi:hypothetical protein